MTKWYQSKRNQIQLIKSYPIMYRWWVVYGGHNVRTILREDGCITAILQRVPIQILQVSAALYCALVMSCVSCFSCCLLFFSSLPLLLLLPDLTNKHYTVLYGSLIMSCFHSSLFSCLLLSFLLSLFSSHRPFKWALLSLFISHIHSILLFSSSVPTHFSHPSYLFSIHTQSFHPH